VPSQSRRSAAQLIHNILSAEGLFLICSTDSQETNQEEIMAESYRMQNEMAVEDEPVTDDEVNEAIALLGGDPREAARALIGTLHRLVARSYSAGPLPVVRGRERQDRESARGLLRAH
jgi:hypothetical protein